MPEVRRDPAPRTIGEGDAVHLPRLPQAIQGGGGAEGGRERKNARSCVASALTCRQGARRPVGMSTPEKFADAQKRVKALSTAPSTEDLLELYALYKQSSEGDVTGSRPGMMDFKARAKFDAWAKKKGTAKDAAMTSYVALVDRLTGA